MIADVIGYLLIGAFLIFLRTAFERWLSRAPEPDGLFDGERLIHGLRAGLHIDDARGWGNGFAYLTDFRLVWTPNIGPLGGNQHMGAIYQEPVIVEMAQIRKVKATSFLLVFRSTLVVEAPDVRLRLWVDGRSFASWERYILQNARNLLPEDQPVLRTRQRYSRQEILATSKGSALFLGLLLLLFGARVLETAVDLGGDSLSTTQFLAIVVAVVALGLAAFAWETRQP